MKCSIGKTRLHKKKLNIASVNWKNPFIRLGSIINRNQLLHAYNQKKNFQLICAALLLRRRLCRSQPWSIPQRHSFIKHWRRPWQQSHGRVQQTIALQSLMLRSSAPYAAGINIMFIECHLLSDGSKRGKAKQPKARGRIKYLLVWQCRISKRVPFTMCWASSSSSCESQNEHGVLQLEQPAFIAPHYGPKCVRELNRSRYRGIVKYG